MMRVRLGCALAALAAACIGGCGSRCSLDGTHKLFAVGTPNNPSSCPATLEGEVTISGEHQATLAIDGLTATGCDPNVQTFDDACRIDMTCTLQGAAGAALDAHAEYGFDDTVVHDEGFVSFLRINDGTGDGGCVGLYDWTVTR